MTVYVTQGELITNPATGKPQVIGPQDQDISSAEDYGKLFSLLPPGQVTYSIGQSTLRLNRVLKDFNDRDYLLLIGDPLAIGLAVAIAARWNNGHVNFLKWDRGIRKYRALEANIYQQTMTEEQAR